MRRFARLTLQTIGGITLLAAVAAALAMLLLGQWLQYQPPLEKADYLVPLAGNDYRLLTAVDLYKQGYAPMILLSNAHVRPIGRLGEIEAQLGQSYIHPYEMRRRLLDHLGVPPAVTAEFGHGHVSTTEEAESLRQFLGGRAAKIILVTSPSHARRATIIFRSVMPQAQFLVAVTPENRLSDPWWSEQVSALLAMSEAMKLTFFWLGGVFRAPSHARQIGEAG